MYYGDQFGQAPKDGRPVYRVREGDPTMHMLVFERDGKQDVLVTNWRAHPHRSGGKEKYAIDADVIGALREYVHEQTDYCFAYFQGAAGNMNTTSRIAGETAERGKIKEYGQALGAQLLAGLANLEPVETGLIQTEKIIYAARVNHSEDDKHVAAEELVAYYNNNPVEMNIYETQIAKAAEYGFTSVFHASRLLTKYRLGETKDLELNVFSIGDAIAFYTAPAELWDSFGEIMEEESPFDMTFCIGYSNGGVAYIPYRVDYSSYEYHYCLFEQDATIDQMKCLYLEAMDAQYASAQ